MPEHGVRCFLGMGSNLQAPRQQLQTALSALRATSDLSLGAVSPVYRSAPLGVAGQPDYCNAVVEVFTDLEALQLLDCLQSIEKQQGRERNATQRWGPRTLDLDLLLYGGYVINSERLTVPHPEMHKRNFVMRPLADIAPDVAIPGLGAAAELARVLGGQGLAPWAEAE